VGRDPGIHLVRLALAGERDVDGKLLSQSAPDGPLDSAERLKLRGLAARVVEGDGDDQALTLAGTAIRPGQLASRSAEVNAGTNSAPR
jgi:hypothetical protein